MRGRPASRLLTAVAAACGIALLVAGAGVGSAGAAYPLQRLDQPKLDSQLGQIAQTAATQGQPAALARADAAGLPSDQGRVRVIVVARSGSVTAAIARAGGSVVAASGKLTEALVPVTGLARLAGEPSVREVRPPLPHAATAVDEAVHLSDADSWHTAGIGGAGVKVAVIDLGFAGYQALLGTALPNTVTAIDHCSGNITAPPPTGTDHGTAVAELVHQMAPAAQLYLICIDSEVGLAQAEQDAITDGVKIVNHSVAWFNTSRGDGSGDPGTPDAIVADARAHGILWVNAAGNYGEDHWAGSIPPDQSFATFPASGDQFDRVTIQNGETACAYLKWDAWPVTSEDYDLGLVRMSDSSLVAASVNDQADGPLAPTEGLCFTNAGSTDVFGIEIATFNAVGSPRLDLFFDGSSALQSANAGSITEPASSSFAVAVGAQCWEDNAAEDYTSRGPTIDGRFKPDLMGQDKVSTETYGPASGCNAGSGFAGTSAASPQVAGAAALLEQHDPAITPAGIQAALEASADETANDSLPGSQFDYVHGHGLLSMPPLSNQERIALDIGNFSYGTLPLHTSGVVVMNADGSGARFLAPTSATTGAVSWSPDGRSFAYTAAGHTQLLDANGGNARTSNTVGNQFDPAWGPSASELAYSDGKDIWVGTPGAEGGTKLTADGVANANIEPTWSPDGSQIVWIHTGQVWVMDADGSNKTLLYSSSTAAFPNWSPDGQHIIFLDGTGGNHVEVIDSTGANPTTAAVTHVNATTRPAWLPDSTSFGYTGDLSIPLTPLYVGAFGGGSPSGLSINFSSGWDDPVSLVFKGQAWQPAAALLTAPENNAMSSINGTAAVGGTLNEPWSGWTGATPMSFTYQWQRCNSSGLSCNDIAGATDSSYLLTAADPGSTIGIKVTATNENGSDTGQIVDGSVVVGPTPSATTLPTAFGLTTVGSTLSGLNGTWVNASSPFTHRWLRCADDGTGCTPISGASGSSYTLTSGDAGSTLRVAVGEPYNGGTVWSSSEPSAIVTGGGGGGGGGSSRLDLATSIFPSATQIAPGGSVTLRIAVNDLTKTPATHLHVTVGFPTDAVVGYTQTDRGSGCKPSAAGQLICDLDYLSGSPTVGNILIILTFPNAETATVTATARADQIDSIPINDTGTAVINVGATATPPPPPTGPPPPKPLAAPKLKQVNTRTLSAVTHGSAKTVDGKFTTNEALKLSLTVTPYRATRRLSLLRTTRLGSTTARVTTTVLKGSVTRATTVAFHVVLRKGALAKGKTYAVHIGATNAHGKTTSIGVRFRG